MEAVIRRHVSRRHGIDHYTRKMRKRSRRPRWGQHFLRDPRILARIADSALGGGPDLVDGLIVEIGPGRGALTQQLLTRGGRVAAIEIDPELVAFLGEKFKDADNFELIHADLLDVDLAKFIRDRSDSPASVTGNLPYYITSPILRAIFDASEAVSRAVVMMQKEVADRVVAQPGTRDYAFLSVLCQLYSRPRRLFRVPARAFQPPPDVTSALVEFTLDQTAAPDPEFVEFLKLSFAHPRKTLLNNLSARYDRAALAELETTRRRAQQLGLEQLRALWQVASETGRAPGRDEHSCLS